MNTAGPEQAPEILFNKHGEIIVIALPELLEYQVVQTVLMKSPIKPEEPTTFIFPGVILKALGAAYYLPVGELTLFEGQGGEDPGIAFTYGGRPYSVPPFELAGYTVPAEVRALQPLEESGYVTPFDGSLLRDRDGGLYYLPTGAFVTLTSFAKAVRDT